MKKSTGELLELLKRTSAPSSFMKSASEDLIRQIPLSKYLNQILDSHSLQKSELIRRSGLDRSYVYDILSGKENLPATKSWHFASPYRFPLMKPKGSSKRPVMRLFMSGLNGTASFSSDCNTA